MTRNPLDHANAAGIVRAHDYQQGINAMDLEQRRDEARQEVLMRKEELRHAPSESLRAAAYTNLKHAARRLVELMETA